MCEIGANGPKLKRFFLFAQRTCLGLELQEVWFACWAKGDEVRRAGQHAEHLVRRMHDDPAGEHAFEQLTDCRDRDRLLDPGCWALISREPPEVSE